MVEEDSIDVDAVIVSLVLYTVVNVSKIIATMSYIILTCIVFIF